MKRFFTFLCAISMIAVGCENGGNIDGNGADVNSKIATVEEQCANIQATIATLQTTKSAIDDTIASLNSTSPLSRGGNEGVKDMIAALEERVAALEAMIASLQGYTEGELAGFADWVEATYATMEQYSALAAELATLKSLLETFDGVSTEALEKALADSEESMKSWVNEQLSGYATIAEVDAQIAALQAAMSESNEELRSEIEALTATLATLKGEIEESYKSAIASAINEFAGVVNEQIANEIAAVNKRIDDELATINSRLDAIEKRLDEIEEAIEKLISQIQSLEYIDQNGDEPTPIETSVEGTTVTLNFRVSPTKAAADLALNWQEYVKVQGYYVDDINTVVYLPITSYSGNSDTGMITVVASGENLSDKFYTDLQSASIYLKISDGNNDRTSSSIPIKAQRWMREDTDLLPANNEIYYTSADGNAVTPKKVDVFGATFQSNLYDWGKGVFVLKFDGDVTSVGYQAFQTSSSDTNTTLRQLRLAMLPNSVTSLGDGAFRSTTIVNIRLSENLISIGQLAFDNCHQLIDITIPESVTTIGKDAFSYCGKLQKFYGKFASKDNCCLVIDGVLHRTVSKFTTNKYTLPEEVKWFGDGCIYIKTANFSFTIPDSVEGLGTNVNTITESSSAIKTLTGKFVVDSRSMVIDGVLCGAAGYQLANYKMPEGITKVAQMLMYNCSYLQEVWIPKSVKIIGASAFRDCSKLKFVYCAAITPPALGSNVFNGVDDNLTIYVPRNSLAKYQQSSYWKDFAINLVAYDGFAPEDDNGGSGDSGSGSVAEAKGWLWYTNGSTTTATKPNDSGAFNAKIISNLYDKEKGCWTISFDAPVTTIGMRAFQNCTTLTSITIPDSVTSIGQDAFNGCSSLSKVYYNGDLSSWCKIGFSNGAANPLAANSQSALYIDGKVVEELIIPSDITEVKFASFRGCGSIKSVVFHDNVTTITKHSFNGCSSLTTVTIGSGVTSIGIQTFYNCANLTSVYCKPTTPPSGEKNMFAKSASGCKIYVPTASVDAYKKADYWSDYADYIEGYDF